MSDISGSQNATPAYPLFSRGDIQAVNEAKGISGQDYAYSKYLAQSTFFSELNRMLAGIAKTGKIKTFDGTELDVNTLGGQLALNAVTNRLTEAKDIFTGIADVGLNNEKDLWKFN